MGIVLACAGTARETTPPVAPPPGPVSVASAAPVASVPPSPDPETQAPEDEGCGRNWEPEDSPEAPSQWSAVGLHEREPSDALSKLCEALAKRAQPTDPEMFMCYVRPGPETQGVWAFFVEHPDPNRPEQYWRLAYAAPNGTIAVAATKTPFSNVEVPSMDGGDLPRQGELRAITDFDRNGSPEVIVRSSRPLDSSGTPGWTYEIWTVRGASIVRYAPAEKLNVAWVEDVDSDGVPDLLIDPHGILVGDGSYWSGAKRDWSLVAHAKPDGTFSQNDAAAEKYARRLCPKQPRFPAALSGGSVCFAGAIHCARLWGVATETIVDAVAQACADAQGDPACEINQSEWARVAKANLPLTLK